jgi:hypothetical protein
MPVRNLVNDNLDITPWLGEVVDIEDPLKIGRIRIKVFGKFDEIPTEDIPWAYPANNVTAGSDSGGGFFSVPKLGSIVSVRFDNGNLYHPEYYYVQKISNEVKAEIENSYTNSHVVIYDTVTEGSLKIFFTEEKGLVLNYKDTKINVKPDNSLFIDNPNGDSIELKNDGNITIITSKKATVKSPAVVIDAADTIELGKGATEKVVLGDSFLKLFNAHTHIGNLGAPTTPPVIPMTLAHLSQKPKVTTK